MLGRLDDPSEGRHVLDKLRENPQAALGRLVEENVGAHGIAHRAHTDLARFDLEHGFDCALEGVLQSDDAVGLQAQGLDGLDVERVSEGGSPELDDAVFLAGVGIRFRH